MPSAMSRKESDYPNLSHGGNSQAVLAREHEGDTYSGPCHIAATTGCGETCFVLCDNLLLRQFIGSLSNMSSFVFSIQVS